MKYWKPATLVSSILLGASAYASESIEDCAAIADSADRLSCYDRLARPPAPPAPQAPGVEKADNKPLDLTPPVDTPEPVDIPVIELKVNREHASTRRSAEPDPSVIEPRADEEFGLTLFGKRRGDPDLGESIQSHIDSVYESAAGNRVITLSNGQVWMEREPGRRDIDSDQDVVIVKRRWHYSMTLVSENRRVTVQRID